MNHSDCPLSSREQTRNLLIYAANWALIYLASPVSYVGVTQATLLKRLGFTDTTCNLPASVYLWTSVLPIFVAWAFPQVRLLKRLMVTAFFVMGIMSALVGATIVTSGPAAVLAALLVHAGVLGCGNGVVNICQWEIIGKGVSEARRGQALGLAFGAGPVFAVVASLGSDLLLSGKWLGFLELPTDYRVHYPWDFAIIFFSTIPVMVLASILSSQFIVPRLEAEVERQPFLAGVFGGFGQFLGYRLILFAAIGYVLAYSAHQILQNLSLYAEVLTGEPAATFAGRQQALRFGFKIVAGFVLGWLLIVSNPRALLIATTSLTLIAVGYAMVVPGEAYLISFGILGAGELFGVYYPNYVLGCSAKAHMRRNMAFTSLVTMPVGFAPLLYGSISDYLGRSGERADRLFGFHMSFAASIAISAATVVLVWLALPARPRPKEFDEEIILKP